MVNNRYLESAEGLAVVLIEFQNQWTMPGLYHWLISGVLKEKDTIRNSEALVKRARAIGVPVIHAPLVVDPKNLRGLFAQLSRGLVFKKGSEAANIDPRVYQEGDHIVLGRTGFDAFVDSDLEQTLRKLAVKTVLFGGFATDQCVAKTMMTAESKGFSGLLVADCTATFTAGIQRHTERKYQHKVVTSNILCDIAPEPLHS